MSELTPEPEHSASPIKPLPLTVVPAAIEYVTSRAPGSFFFYVKEHGFTGTYIEMMDQLRAAEAIIYKVLGVYEKEEKHDVS